MTIRGINRQSYVIATAAHIGFAVTKSKINKGMSFIFIFLWTKKKEMAGRRGNEQRSKQEKKAVD